MAMAKVEHNGWEQMLPDAISFQRIIFLQQPLVWYVGHWEFVEGDSRGRPSARLAQQNAAIYSGDMAFGST